MKPWHVVIDTSQQDELGNGPTNIAISTYPDDTADAIAWMQEGTEDDALKMAAAREMLHALKQIKNHLLHVCPHYIEQAISLAEHGHNHTIID